MIVNCAAYKQGQKIRDLSIDQISEALAQPDTFVWVGLADPKEGELAILGREFTLHGLALEDAQRGHQRPKIEEYGDSLFAVLHTVEYDLDGELGLGEVAIFVGSNYICSIRKQTMQGFGAVRKRCERESELLKHGSIFVFYALIDTVVDRYFPVVEQLEQKLEGIEERLFSKSASTRTNVEALYALKRQLMTVQHAVTSLLESVSKLHGHGGRVPPLCQNMQEYFRDVSDHMMRIEKSIESAREMTTTAIQVNLSLVSLVEAEVTKKLASYGALFAIPTAIAGIYGMNFKFMPELSWAYGYPMVVSFIIITDIALWFRFRRVGWL